MMLSSCSDMLTSSTEDDGKGRVVFLGPLRLHSEENYISSVSFNQICNRYIQSRGLVYSLGEVKSPNCTDCFRSGSKFSTKFFFLL